MIKGDDFLIRCNLSVLLAERNLKITQVSKDTGISRTTLTSLANNHSQGIQLETLNKLCIYLQITPGDLFIYVPFEFDVCVKKIDTEKFEVELEFRPKDQILKIVFIAEVSADYNYDLGEQIVNKFRAHLSFKNYNEYLDQIAHKYLKNLPTTFRKDIEDKICDEIEFGLIKFEYLWQRCPAIIIWPDELI